MMAMTGTDNSPAKFAIPMRVATSAENRRERALQMAFDLYKDSDMDASIVVDAAKKFETYLKGSE